MAIKLDLSKTYDQLEREYFMCHGKDRVQSTMAMLGLTMYFLNNILNPT